MKGNGELINCERGRAQLDHHRPARPHPGHAGYKFEFAQRRFYMLPQAGIAYVAYKSNPWPIYEDETLTKEVGETPFMLGSLRFGVNF
jgi:hypothetical protein